MLHPSKIIKEFGCDTLDGVKITLINMPLREGAIPNTPPLGPALIAARLQEFGAKLSIVDLNIYRKKDAEAKNKGLENGRHLTLEEVRNLLTRHFRKHGSPDMIGLSGLITTLRWQTNVAKVLKELEPDSFLVSGGGLATEIKAPLFTWIPELDGIIIGEGDDVVIKTAFDAMIIKRNGLESAKNSGKLQPYCVGKINKKNRFVYLGQRPLDLNSLPLPAWDLFEKDVQGFKIFERYLKAPVWGSSKTKNSSATPFTMERSATTISSRGCPFKCKFCYRGTQGQSNYGGRSAQNLAEEVEWLIQKYGVDFVGFNDDNFMVSRQRIKDLVPLLKNLNIRWGTHGRLDEAADIFNNNRRIDLMAEAGCVYIGFGGESAHIEVLERMNKGKSVISSGTVPVDEYNFPKVYVEGIKASHQAGIHGNCTWIMGYPGETLEHLKTTVAFIKWQEELHTGGLKPSSKEYKTAINSVNKSIFVATAYPGTEMCKEKAVRQKLTENFGIIFYFETNDPIFGNQLREYILELDDASKILSGPSGQPLNFSEMSDDIFLQACEYIRNNEIFKILDM